MLFTAFHHQVKQLLQNVVSIKRKKTNEADTVNRNGEREKLCLQERYVRSKLHKENLFVYVHLPKGIEENEWIATHNHCTIESCPTMSGGQNLVFYWMTDKNKKTRPPAPQYIEIVMTWIEKQIKDESVFPTKYGNEFPPTYKDTVRKIFRFFFHIIAHIYYNHFQEMIDFELVPHLNTLFHHFVLFSQHFNLVDQKDLAPLETLINMLVAEK